MRKLILFGVGVCCLMANSAGATVLTEAGGYATTVDFWNQYVTPTPVGVTPNVNDQVYNNWLPSLTNASSASSGPITSGGSDSLTEAYSPDGTSTFPVTWTTSGSAITSGNATAGTLHAYAQAQAQVPQSSATFDYTDAQGNAAADTEWNPFAMRSSAETFTGWVDTFTVTSSTLPISTPVTLALTIQLDSSVLNPTGTVYTNAGAALKLHYTNSSFDSVILNTDTYAYQPKMTVSTMMYAAVGDSFMLEGLLDVRAQALAYAWQDPTGSFPAGTSVPSVEAYADASNTAGFYVDSLTAGASVQSESGHNYATAVPEPSTFSLLGVGLVALGLIRLRRG